MTLHTKTLAAVGTTLLGSVLLLNFAGRAVVLRSFQELEDQAVRHDVGLVRNALAEQLDALGAQAMDWSVWDDSYAFVADANEEYAAANLVENSFVNIHVNLMAFMRPDGRLVAVRWADLATKQFEEPPLMFQQDWSADNPLLQRTLQPDGVTGLILLPEGPVLLAGRPIVTSTGEGPARGAFFIGCAFDAAKIQHLGQATGLDLSFASPSGDEISRELLTAATGSPGPPPILVRPVDARVVAGYTLVRDLHDQPVLVLRARLPRDIYRQGGRSAYTLVLTVLIVGGIFGVLVLLLVERLVVEPVRRISGEVRALGTRQDPRARVAANSRDELGRLAESINVMLAARERSHRDLAESEERFRELFENARDAIFWADPQTGLLLNCNQAAATLVQRARADLIGQPQSVLHPPEKAAHYTTLLRRHVEQQESLDDDIEVLTSSGAVRTVRISTGVTSVGAQRIIQSIFHDTTERRQAEQQLQRANAMLTAALEREQHVAMQLEATMQQLEAAMRDAQAANQSKSDFLANMSHEIRTPLTAINGFAEVLAEEITSCTVCPAHAGCETRQATCQHILAIRTNGKHLLALINDILDLSKIEAGKLEVEQIQCSPCELIASVQSPMMARARSKGLEFRVDYASAVPEFLVTDPTRLRQILFNLLGNAIKFTARGEVRLEVQYIVDPQHPELRFEVHDSGIGMTPEQLSRVFQPFVQGDASATRRFGGTGLGLVISKRLAEALGGGVTVDSTAGQGSVFHVRIAVGTVENAKLIARPEDATAAKPAASPETALNIKLTGRILLAEDGPDNQRLLGFILRKAGAEVTMADNGQEALDMAWLAHETGRPFDVVLMDIQMPVLSGYEATRRLRERGYKLPIIALTAHAMSSARDKCLACGCNDFCTKPIDRAALLETIARHLHKPAPV
jgi:PAS domain S-box-containing protein